MCIIFVFVKATWGQSGLEKEVCTGMSSVHVLTSRVLSEDQGKTFQFFKFGKLMLVGQVHKEVAKFKRMKMLNIDVRMSVCLHAVVNTELRAPLCLNATSHTAACTDV